MSAPDPLVAPDVDLRGYLYMPLYGDRLFKSATWISASAEAKVAAMRLWWHAWAHEVPAASLPSDDVLLAEYAGYGVAVRAWQKIKPQAMRGFIECSDGRLYHDKLAEWAIEAWELRVNERQRKAKWREKRRDRDGTETGTGTGTETGQGAGQGRDVPSEGKVSEAKRSEAKVRSLNPAVGVTPTIDARATGSQGKGKKAPNGNGAESWSAPEWVAATAKTLGMERRTGERDRDFADRVHHEVDGRRRKAKAEADARGRAS